MHKPSDPDETTLAHLRQQVLGLGERSFRKSWYPELQARLDELELFRALLDCAIDAIFLVQVVPMQLIDANITAAELLGTTSELLRTRPITDFVPHAILEHIERNTSTDRASPLLESWPTVGEGRELETFVRFSGDAPRLHAILTVRDVTERRVLERQALTSQRLEVVGRLAGGIAHDFNNLLGAIIGTVELVRSELHPESPLARTLADVTFAADRAALLTRRLMTFGRMGSGKPSLVNVVALVDDLMRLLVRIVGERATIVVQNDVAQIWVLAEPIAIEQVVVNLVSNARDAVGMGGSIFVRVRAIAERTGTEEVASCLIEVEDNGVGMDAETQRRVFEPFFTTKEASRGTGLGLSVVANVVANSGGRIELVSGPGRGTRFRLYFPCHQPPARTDRPCGQAASDVRGGNRLVFVVEDEPLLRETIVRTLQKNGFEVTSAGDVDEAAFRCRRCRQSPALLISDMVLPDGTGSDVVGLINKMWGAIPTLFISGYVGGEATQDSGQASAILLPKPFTPQALIEQIAFVLQEG